MYCPIHTLDAAVAKQMAPAARLSVHVRTKLHHYLEYLVHQKQSPMQLSWNHVDPPHGSVIQ